MRILRSEQLDMIIAMCEARIENNEGLTEFPTDSKYYPNERELEILNNENRICAELSDLASQQLKAKALIKALLLRGQVEELIDEFKDRRKQVRDDLELLIKKVTV